MLLATLLALGAAVLHSGWNLAAKRATGDRYAVLWAQFVAAGLMSFPAMVVCHVVWGMPLHEANFRRKVLGTPGFVQPTGETAPTDGRPAQLYRRGGARTLHPPILRPS